MNMQHLSIGAVEQITQIPAHTLRKWEARHQIAVPVRTETGRRVYTEAQVEQLKLIKHLVDHRHSVSDLAGLDMAALKALAGLHSSETPTAHAASLRLIGPGVQSLLAGDPWVTERYPGSFRDWVERATDVGEDALVVEADLLPELLIDALGRFRARCASLLVVYRFASRAAVRALEQHDIACVRGPIEDDVLKAYVRPHDDVPERHVDVRPSRFSQEELARLGALSPSLACECPNHIAKLIMDISSFERYSGQCVDTDPDERRLHERLALISGQARVLFEEALIAVAAADGIRLEYDDT